MDFEDTPEQAEFRQKAIEFLEEFAPQVGGQDDSSSMYISDPAEEKAYVQRCRDWQRIKYENGWAGLTWPKEFGGQEITGIMEGIFKEEEAKRISASGIFAVSIGMVGPTIIAHGTKEQQEHYLPRMLMAKTAGVSCFQSRVRAQTLEGFARWQCVTAMSGS